MAITGDKSTTLAAPASSTYKYTLRAFFEEQGTDTTNNTSKIYVEASLAASQIAFDNNKGGTLSIYWHDNNTNTDTLVASLNVKQCGKTYGTKWIGATIYPTHKSDGTLSGYAIAKWEKLVSNNYIPASGSVSTDNTALTNIPRQATADSVAGFTDEQNPVLRYTNNAGNAVSSLQACIALTTSEAASNPTVAWRDISKTGNSYTFNLTEAERTALRNATSGQSRNLWFYVKTVLNGVTYYSYAIGKMTIVNANPFIDTISYSDINTETTDLTNNDQVIIQGMSRLQFQFFDVEALKGATLSSLSININGNVRTVPFSGSSITRTDYTYGELDVSENINAILTLTDSRGFSSSFTVPITVWDYEQPTAIITVSRESNFYSQCHIKVDAKYSSLNNLNTIDIQYRIKKSTDTNWGAWTPLQDNVEASFTADNLYAWDLQVYLEDALETTHLYTINKALDVGIPLVFYDLKKRSVGVNTMPQNTGSLEVDGIDLRNIYTTTDQKVGTWIDGKPIYRRVITKANTNAITNALDNVDNIIKMDCLVRRKTTIEWRNLPWLYVNSDTYGNAVWAGGFYYNQSQNTIYFQVGSSLSDIDRLILIIEYTKTTD